MSNSHSRAICPRRILSADKRIQEQQLLQCSFGLTYSYKQEFNITEVNPSYTFLLEYLLKSTISYWKVMPSQVQEILINSKYFQQSTAEKITADLKRNKFTFISIHSCFTSKESHKQVKGGQCNTLKAKLHCGSESGVPTKSWTSL